MINMEAHIKTGRFNWHLQILILNKAAIPSFNALKSRLE